jgi:hypothetical protein
MDEAQEMLRKWREDRAAHPHRDAPSDHRQVEVKGQQVMVVRKKTKRPLRVE